MKEAKKMRWQPPYDPDEVSEMLELVEDCASHYKGYADQDDLEIIDPFPENKSRMRELGRSLGLLHPYS